MTKTPENEGITMKTFPLKDKENATPSFFDSAFKSVIAMFEEDGDYAVTQFNKTANPLTHSTQTTLEFYLGNCKLYVGEENGSLTHALVETSGEDWSSQSRSYGAESDGENVDRACNQLYDLLTKAKFSLNKATGKYYAKVGNLWVFFLAEEDRFKFKVLSAEPESILPSAPESFLKFIESVEHAKPEDISVRRYCLEDSIQTDFELSGYFFSAEYSIDSRINARRLESILVSTDPSIFEEFWENSWMFNRYSSVENAIVPEIHSFLQDLIHGVHEEKQGGNFYVDDGGMKNTQWSVNKDGYGRYDGRFYFGSHQQFDFLVNDDDDAFYLTENN